MSYQDWVIGFYEQGVSPIKTALLLKFERDFVIKTIKEHEDKKCVQSILREVFEGTEFRHEDVRVRKRSKEIRFLRQEASWRLRRELGLSYQKIADIMGISVHATIVNDVKAYESRLMNNSKNTVGTARLPKIKRDMADIIRRLDVLRVDVDYTSNGLGDLALSTALLSYELKLLSREIDEVHILSLDVDKAVS